MSNGLRDRISNNNNNQKDEETLYYPEPIKKPTSGFKEDQLLVKDKYFLEKYKCLICQEFPFEPVECITVAGEGKSCGALFCKPCYEKYMSSSNNKTCPLRCSRNKLRVSDAFHFKDLINSLVKVKCPQCGETPDYSEYINHLGKCKNRQYICNVCSLKGNLNKIKRHVGKCPEKNVKCELCGEIVKFKNLDDHKNNLCKEKIINCPECGIKISVKNYSSHHLSVDCLQKQINDLKIKLNEKINKMDKLYKQMMKSKKENELKGKKLNNGDSCCKKTTKFLFFIIIPLICFYCFEKLNKEKN